MPVLWSLPRSHAYFHGKKPSFLLFSFRLFFLLCLFSFASFFFCVFIVHLFSDYLTSARVSWRQFIVESCASPSNNLISLSYSLPVFSANLFRLFFAQTLQSTYWKLPWYPLALIITCSPTMYVSNLRLFGCNNLENFHSFWHFFIMEYILFSFFGGKLWLKRRGEN